jgi:hypothetical protein
MDKSPEQFRLRQQDLAWREVEDEVIVLDTKGSLYASINRSGRLLWLRLGEGASLEQLTDVLVESYGMDRAAAAADAEAFVSSLRTQELLE